MSPMKMKDSKKVNNKNNNKKKLRKNKDSDSESDEEIYLEEDSDEDYETVSESSDSSYKPPKHKKSKKNRNRKVESESDDETVDEDSDDDETIGEEDSDDEDYDDEEDNDDSFIDDDEEEEQVSKKDVQKMIAKMFPSKYMNERVKSSNKKKATTDKKSKSDKKYKHSSRQKDKKKRKSEESESEEYEEDDEDEEDSDDEEDDAKENKIDIVFAIGGGGHEGVYEDEYNDEDDDNDCNSDDEKTFMKEKYETVDIPKSKATMKKEKKELEKRTKKEKKTPKPDSEVELTDVEQEYLDLAETKKQLSQQLLKKPKSKILLNAIEECNHSIKKLVKKARIKNAKNYHKLIHTEKKYTNEIDYFKKKLSNKEQLKVMKDLKEINSHINIEKPYRLALLESKMPAKFKATALQKLNILNSMDPCDSEYYKIKNWVDTFMRIPFCVYKSLSVKMDDGLDACHDYMTNAKRILDDCTYGLNDAKTQIMQMVGQWVSNPGAMGTAIAINGPMGTGKTTLVKEGISKILGREFAFIALGGTGDASFLEGHSYTYEGSSWGKIVQILIDSKCMNPVIYFDELDKVSDTPRGEEIIGILTHLTDTTQNSQYHDKYFSDVDFDLSKCLFIFSYNDESKVNSILKDRMYRIQTKGYESKEKIIIAKNYLLPKIREQVNFREEDIIIPDETIQYIVSNDSLTNGEAGVRNLKRCLEIIYTKLNLFRLVKSGDDIFSKDMDLKVSFPFTVTKKEVDILIKHEDKLSKSMMLMYC